MLQIHEFTEAHLATLTPERVRELLHYEPETGVFTWRVATSRRVKVGDKAGCLHKRDGRVYISVDGKLYKAHRLAWLYMKAEWPAAGIDHRDGAPSNNRFDNLRPASQAENMQNLRKAHRDSSSGLLGAQRLRNGKWIARLLCKGIRVDSIRFDTPEQAHAAYLEIKAAFHPFSTLPRSA